jgi:hypothetical protein
MDQDKRIAPRFSFPQPVAFGFPEVVVNGSIAGNISASGISLKVQEFVPMGAVLELQLRLGPSSKIVWVKAQVVRMREVLSEDCFEIGLKFINDENALKAISEYINNQTRS